MQKLKRICSIVVIVCLSASTLLNGMGNLTAYAAPIPITSVNVDWDTVVSETTKMSYGLNTFKIWNPTISSAQGYNDKMEYMNPGYLRLHAWEMMKDYNEHAMGWVDYENKGWKEDKILEALAGLTSISPTKDWNLLCLLELKQKP